MAALVTLVNEFGSIRRPLPGCEHIGVYTLATYAHRVGVNLSATELRYFARLENTALLMLSEHEKAKSVVN